ncbi:MAG: FMN-binding glutamate synthase family protein [Candidatus Aminicenantes bacterium]|nr:FMN-binding glutamate synthase family protein [Candidatus Aminicenantes bacterium]
MAYTKLNRSAATLTKNRTEGSISPFSGMCVTCVDGCIGMCEIGKSAYRGSEVLYPQPFGIITAASEKDYPIDLSHFTILGTAAGAHGVRADSDSATFEKVSVDTTIGADNSLKLKVPFIIPGMGSTNVAKQNWEGLAIGAALSGSMLTIGENVCAMDPGSEIKNGRVIHSPDMENRVKLFQDWRDDGYGTIAVQANVEDTRLGVQEYTIEKLGVESVELKWGQGAKDIGGEVKIKNLSKAQNLKKRGYIVLPDPEDPDVIEAFKKGSFKEFERHSRLGMVEEDSFMQRVEELRKAGAKYIFLKTGAYRPVDLARAVKFASKAKLDLLTVDGAGGGTGMSPWRMMNEWGIPSVEIWSLTYKYIKRLDEKGEYVPPVCFAGGITFEDQIYKALALGAPYVKAVGMARSPLAAAMVGKTIGKRIKEQQIPVYVERFGDEIQEIFSNAPELKHKYGEKFNQLPTGALGVHSYFKRLNQGLRQFMAGNRKFAFKYIERGDIASLTKEVAEVSGIPYITDVDKEEVDKILNS